MDSSDFADFECFARTGANAPATIFPKRSDGCFTPPFRRRRHYWLTLADVRRNPALTLRTTVRPAGLA